MFLYIFLFRERSEDKNSVGQEEGSPSVVEQVQIKTETRGVCTLKSVLWIKKTRNQEAGLFTPIILWRVYLKNTLNSLNYKHFTNLTMDSVLFTVIYNR